MIVYFIAQLLFRFGIKRDERRLEGYRASVAQCISNYKDTTDFERANGILARYEAEAALSYDDLRKNRQKIVKDKQNRDMQAARAADAAMAALKQSANRAKRSFWDALMILLMGDDDEDGPRIGLICRKCAFHNGFVGLLKYPGHCL